MNYKRCDMGTTENRAVIARLRRFMVKWTLSLSRLHRDERGSLAIGHIYWVAVFSLLIAFLFNMGFSTKKRSELQRPATAISHPVGVWRARGMNVVSAHQHLQGEVIAMLILHHAIGGDELDAGRVGDTRRQDRALDNAWRAASIMGASTPYYRQVRREVRAGAMLLRANRNLKEILTTIYINKAIAKGMQRSIFWPVVAAGRLLEQIMDIYEKQIGREWEALNRLAIQARSMLPLKRAIIQLYLPAARDQLERMVNAIPAITQQTAEQLADRYGVKVFVAKSDRSLPIEKDPYAKLQRPPFGYERPLDCDCPSVPADNPRYQMVKTTQMARASFPWVVYHRVAMMERLFIRAPFSKAAFIYEEESAGQARLILDRLQAARNLGFYVLPGKVAPDKGWEKWTFANNSKMADQHFSSIVLTGQPLESPVGSPFAFASAEDEHWVRWESVMLINDNPQRRPRERIDLLGCKRIVPDEQAIVGYDTLAWDQRRGRQPELVAGGWPDVFPRIKNGWTFTPSIVTDYQNHRLKSLSMPTWASSIKPQLPSRLHP
jgi:hypothetical protein